MRYANTISTVLLRQSNDTKEQNTMLVYLGGPIDDVSRKDALDWRQQIAGELASVGIATFDPAACFAKVDNLHEQDKYKIVNIDRQAIAECDVLYAFLPSDQHMVGTIREIEFARGLHMSVIVVTDKRHMVWLCDCEVFADHTSAMEKVRTLNHEWKKKLSS